MSDYYHRPIRMACEDDGRIRTVYVRCCCFDGSFAADTFFTVPAYIRLRGRFTRGFVSSGESGLYFTAFNYAKPRFWLNHK